MPVATSVQGASTSAVPADVVRPNVTSRWRETVIEHPLPVVFSVAAVVVRLIFTIYTKRIWEDAYITVTHARNVIDGIGLTHHASERVHGFTSALSVLIPLPGEVLGQGLLSLRIASVVASVVTIVFAYRVARHLGVATLPMVFLLSFLAFDQQQVFFGMSGMETQVATAVLMVGFFYLLEEEPMKVSAIAGLAVLARPDFILWAGAAFAVLVLRRNRAFPLWKLAVPLVVVLGPWVLFTTLYYGSPIPHTITAKNLYPNVGLSSSPSVQDLVTYAANWWRSFAPFYENSFVVTTPVPKFLLQQIAVVFMALAAGGAWAHRRRPAVVATAAFVVAFVGYRTLARLPVYFTWYLPPFTAICAVLAAASLTRLRENFAKSTGVVSVALALAFAMHIPWTYPLEKRVQRDLEVGVRVRVGEYLGREMASGDTVVFEPVGYFGWFAGNDKTTYDYPGLTSEIAENALAAAEPGDRTLELLMRKLVPDWAVLRPGELEFIRMKNPDLLAEYEVAKEFTVRPDLDLDSAGLSYLSIDTKFTVLRHR